MSGCGCGRDHRVAEVGDERTDEVAVTAAHEWGHWVAAEDAGLRPYDMRINEDGSGYIRREMPDERVPGQVAGAQALSLAGQIAEDRWCREHGLPRIDSSSGDRAIFEQTAGLDGSVSWGAARRQAEVLVNRHWGRISSQAESYLEAGR